MKKYLIILTVMFYYGNIVEVPVPKFYSKVCSGEGEVIGKNSKIITDDDLGSSHTSYLVKMLPARCPMPNTWIPVHHLNLIRSK